MYERGQGVSQNLVQAQMWYNLSVAHGEQRAAKIRDALANQMTAGQIAEAQRLAQEWKSKDRAGVFPTTAGSKSPKVVKVLSTSHQPAEELSTFAEEGSATAKYLHKLAEAGNASLKTHSACCITKARVYPRTLGKRRSGLKRPRNKGMRERKSTSEHCTSRDGAPTATREALVWFSGRQRNEMLWLSRNLGACMNEGKEYPRI